MKIAEFTNSIFSVEHLLRSQLLDLAKRGHELYVIAPQDGPAPSVDAEFIPLKLRREFHLNDLSTLFALCRILKSHQFDVLHTHTPKPGILGPLAGRLTNTSVVHSVHGLLMHDRQPLVKRSVAYVLERCTAWLADQLLFQSKEDYEYVARRRWKDRSRLHYVGNGIDVRWFSRDATRARDEVRSQLGFPPKAFVVGMIARLVYEKGVKEFIDSAQRFRDGAFCFLLLGPRDPDQRDAIPMALIRRAEATAKFRYAGYQRDPRPYYAAMDAVWLPSHREGIPRVLMEASAMELPVVAPNIRGCREVVRHGVSGLLYAPGNVEAAKEALMRIWRLPDRGRGMGRHGRQFIMEHFAESVVLDRVAAVLERKEFL